MKLQLCQDSDMQEYIQVSLSSARLTIFDFKSLDYVVFVIKQLAYSLDKELEYTLQDYRLLINVSSFGKVVLSLTNAKGDVLNTSFLDVVTLSYFRKITESPFDKFELPDVLVLLSYFLTEKQRSLAGL